MNDFVQPKFSCLVLEDDEDCADLLTRTIEAEGGVPTVCPTIKAAKEAAEQGDFDVFVIDNGLPDGTGSAFFYHLRSQHIEAPVIMLTGAPQLSLAVELTRNGLFDYLSKPFNYSEFALRLRKAVSLINNGDPEVTFMDFVGKSPVMKENLRLIQQAAQNLGAPVLLTGETGVGKDLTARMIHHFSFQHSKTPPPFVNLNCATLPTEMFEAELFGAEKGAYTGAHQNRIGLVEAAGEGTLLLDEIGEVPFGLQSKLLQFLETREYRRLGSTAPKHFEGRIIAATNKCLPDEVKAGRFRVDLWYRLDVLTINVPPLRERREDIPALAELLLDKLAQKYKRRKPAIRHEDLDLLSGHDFPGNVRELRNIVERSLLRTPSDGAWLMVDATLLRKAADEPAISASSIEAQEYTLISATLKEEGGVIRRAASKLGLSHQALLRRLAKWPELRPRR